MNDYSSFGFGFGYDNDSKRDVAQICLNGHLINAATKNSPELSSKFCRKCGQPTIDKCPLCKALIPGHYQTTQSTASSPQLFVPLYCHDCGKPYPWTQLTLDTIKELVSGEDNLTPEEKASIFENLTDIITQTPRSPLAAIKIKTAMEKMSGTGKESLNQLLTDITSLSSE